MGIHLQGRRLGMGKVMLTVFDSNTAALRMYARLGYSRDASSPDPSNAADAHLQGCAFAGRA